MRRPDGILLLESVLAAALFMAAVSAQISAQALLTLEKAVELSLRSHPEIAAAEARHQNAEAGLRQAEAGRLPILAFEETYRHSNNPVFVFGSLLEQNEFGVQNFQLDSLNSPASISNYRSTLNLQIPIFNRRQISSVIEQARTSLAQTDQLQEMVAQQIRFEVIRSFYGVLVAEAREEVAQQSVRTAEAEVKRIQDLVDQGITVASDLLANQVQLADFKQQLIEAQGEVLTAQARLLSLLSPESDRTIQIQGQLKENRFPSSSLEALIETGLTRRPDLQRTKLEMEKRSSAIDAAKGRYLPEFNLFAQLGNSSSQLVRGSSDFTVGASLKLDILNFDRGPRVEQARAAQLEALAQTDQKTRQIRFEIIETFHQMRAAEEKVNVASGAVVQAGEALRIVQDRYEAGLTTVTENLRAQTALLGTRLNLLAARFAYYVGYAQLLLATGQLDNVGPFIS